MMGLWLEVEFWVRVNMVRSNDTERGALSPSAFGTVGDKR